MKAIIAVMLKLGYETTEFYCGLTSIIPELDLGASCLNSDPV